MSYYIDTRNDPDGLEIEAEYSMAYEETEEMKQESRLNFGRRKYGPEFTLDQFPTFEPAPPRTILHKACRFVKRKMIAGLKKFDVFMNENRTWRLLFYRLFLLVLPLFLTKKQRDLKRRIAELGFDTFLFFIPGNDEFECLWTVDYGFTMLKDNYIRGCEKFIEYELAVKELDLAKPDEFDKAVHLQQEYIEFKFINDWHPRLFLCNGKVLKKEMEAKNSERNSYGDTRGKTSQVKSEVESFISYDEDGTIRIKNPNPEIFRD